MRIAIVGAGAMGSVYAALLADAGNDVVVVDLAREHVEAIRRDGLRVEGASGERTVRLDAVTDPSEAGVVDLVVVATKAMDAPAAATASLPLLGDDSVVLTIQNGRGSAEAVAGAVGVERLLVGVAGGFGASILAPGHVRHEGMELVRMGEATGGPSERLERVAGAWRAAGFTVETCPDIERVVWEKLICNATFSGPCGVLDRTIGEVLADADAWAVASSCAREGFEVATALGVGLSFDDPVAHVAAFGSRIPAAYPSLVQDLRAGRRTEIDAINGEIPRAGREVGIEAPVNATVTSVVRALERARGLRD
jgi:2-dehydropantoate 2-reductase